MFRKTCVLSQLTILVNLMGSASYIVATQDSNNLAATVELDEQSLVEVLRTPSVSEL